jgi:imidazolonepropionase-like amidohydrolase
MIRLIATVTVFAAAFPASAEEVVVKAAKVYTLTGAPLAPGAVRIKDGKIAEVAGSIAVPAGAREIDLGSGVLIPGLVDAFSSIAIEGGAAESTREITPNFKVMDAVDWSSRDFRQARADGITTIALDPGSDNVISGLSCVVKTAGDVKNRVVSGDHSLIITLATDPASGNSARSRPDSIYTRQPTNRMGVVWMLRSELARARTVDDKSTAVIRAALEGKRPIICLSRSDNDLAAALRLGKEFSFNMTIAGAHEAYKVRNELAAAKVPLLLGAINSTPGSGPEGTDTILNEAGPLHEAGIQFALTGGKLLDQARLAVRHGLPAEIALGAITAKPAKLLGLESRIGTIAAGRDADLVALSGDPFELTTTIRWTMTDGVLRAEEP